jgi:tetratricopeptide (TPR) repeat protein
MGTASDISYDISGEDVVEVRATPATEAAANLEAFKAAGSAKVAAKDWAGAIVEYEKCVTGYEACKETVSSDFEAERSAEKCALASLSNQALCALKLEDFEGAKAYCGAALKRLKEARVVDESAMAKCHFRKGQAFYGLGDARGAVDAFNDAIALEERQLDKCATDESKKKAATIVSMKRELLKARRAAKEQAKTAASQMSGARGFLKAGARGTGDPKEERKQLVVQKIDCALSFVFSDKDTKGKDAETVIAPNYDAMIDALVAARHGACAAKDLFGELALTFAEGFVAFLASAPEAEASPGRAKYYARCVDAMASYWQLRDELAEDTCDTSLLEPPMNIGDVAALECAAHAHMQLGRHAEACVETNHWFGWS